MSKHSPGPWKADSEAYVVDAESRTVARVTIHGLDVAEQELANQRLIAAAPEMLAMLRRIQDDHAPLWESGFGHDAMDRETFIELVDLLARLDP